MEAIRDFLDQCCLGTLMPKEMYPHLDTFNQVFLLPAVKLFMVEEFMISADQRSYIADMDFDELAETALVWGALSAMFLKLKLKGSYNLKMTLELKYFINKPVINRKL